MKLKSLLAVVALVVSANAQASGEWRVGATTSSLTYSLTTPAVLNFGLSADYGHELSKNLQLVGLGSFNILSAGTSLSAWNIGAGLRYNFDEKIQDSWFIQAALGFGSPLVASVPLNATAAINWKAGVGKRFKISDSVAYSPEVGVNSFTVATVATTSIYANIVNFSIWF